MLWGTEKGVLAVLTPSAGDVIWAEASSWEDVILVYKLGKTSTIK